MTEGAIYHGIHDGHYILRFVGDVRLTLCTSLDLHIEDAFAHQEFDDILVDLTESDCLDSTTLGLIAKLANKAQMQGLQMPVLISTNGDINHTLKCMGFDQVFLMSECLECSHLAADKLDVVQEAAEDMQQRIINAHRVLMSMNRNNFEAFSSLVQTLEKS